VAHISNLASDNVAKTEVKSKGTSVPSSRKIPLDD
jgi:hypothetical protein